MNFLPIWPLEANVLFFFGFLLFCGALGGYLTHRLPWIPSITGFMLVGLIAGPNVLGLFSYDALEKTQGVVDIALALILFRLGLSLDIKSLFQDKALLLISLIECTASFAAVYFALTFFGISPVVAAIVAAIGVSSSPAVLLHVAHELGADGPVVHKAQALIALNNVISFLIFIGLAPLILSNSVAPLQTIVGSPAYQLFGSLALGGIAGWVLHKMAIMTKGAPQYNLTLVVGAVAVTLGLAMMLKLSPLFAPLILGIVVRSLERKKLIANMAFGPAFELFFIALFVYAGANLHLKDMLLVAPAALIFITARSAAKWLAVSAIGASYGWSAKTHLNTGLMLLPMAGMALGLVNTSNAQFPEYAGMVASIVFAAVAVFETLGPPIVATALRWSGDIPELAYENKGSSDPSLALDPELPSNEERPAQT